MQVIFGKQNADMLKDKYTILELETFDANGTPVETYCLVPSEKIAFSDMSSLEGNIKTHEQFVEAIKRNDYKTCSELYIQLIGKFGGELDSFYDEIVKRHV